MDEQNMLFCGFGGQGILFVGKVAAYAGLLAGKEVSWLPSYGPEMRGGTANCSVCLSDTPIGSPLVTQPNILVAMNGPSFDKFLSTVLPGGCVIVDSTLVDRSCERTDLQLFSVPATRLAIENNLEGLANMILLGKLLAATRFVDRQHVEQSLHKCVPANKTHLLEPNLQAICLGMEQ